MEMSVGHGFQIFSVLVPSFSLYPLIITPFFYFFNFCGFFLDKMLRIWKWYQSCLSLHPVKTQIISSGFLWGIGDVAAQYITHSTAKKRLQYHKDDDNEFKVNWKRVAVTSMFGFGFVGPVGHFWYEELDKFIKMRLLLRPKSARFVAAKVAMDGLIFGPFDLFVFFTYMGFSAGKSTAQVKEDVKRDFLPALILEGGVWPIVQCLFVMD
ncbi:hypothetical protein ERO13_A06G063200v2 [Gossypium hirsutum]|uniref:PXMP2/4 family protein 2 isoform X3 n=4 Tax=Gossypium TaxID=3633 RepID=A0ABM3BVN6_GOSHI|nr:PXMP2/4 family protein 2-like isoform X3 [Gossypium hirsutum]KAG4194587.1 hypothetical protein ERO13_A06G063200v2 [Gossypium hirsutum]TYI21980.1 hypothetical protein ES332_A06G075700v1 [Gossypium tomentosum]